MEDEVNQWKTNGLFKTGIMITDTIKCIIVTY